MIADLLISLLLVTGGIFGLVGSFGLLKLRDPMQRLHAPTKATTVGVGTALLASMLYFALLRAEPTWQELIITVFLLVTSPITANFLAKAHLHRSVPPASLPPAGTDRPWATLDIDPQATPPKPAQSATGPVPVPR